MDLALWSERGAHVGMFADLFLRLGAKPYRCEYCRINFISFRRRQEKFSFQRWAKLRKSQNAVDPPSGGGDAGRS
jgi:hypothetical protein